MLRLAASLLLTAAGLFGLISFGISRLDRTAGEGPTGYLLPVSNATLDPRIVTLLGACALGAGLVGAGLLAISPAPSLPARSRRRHRLPRRSIVIVAAGLLALAGALLIRGGGP